MLIIMMMVVVVIIMKVMIIIDMMKMVGSSQLTSRCSRTRTREPTPTSTTMSKRAWDRRPRSGWPMLPRRSPQQGKRLTLLNSKFVENGLFTL